MLRDANNKAEVRPASIFIMLLGLAGIWLGVQYGIAYFGSAKAAKILTETVLANRDLKDDVVMTEAIIDKLKSVPFEAKATDISILRSSDGKSIQVKLTYKYHAAIPFLDRGFDIPFSPEVNESLVARGF